MTRRTRLNPNATAADAVAKSGDTITGQLGLGAAPGEVLDVVGDVTTARRIGTHSYFETDSSGTAETIRMHTGNPTGKTGNSAKNAIAFYQDDISTTQSQVWVQAHDYLHWYNTITFAAAAVNTATDQITATAHGLPTSPGWRVQFTTTGTLPSPLALATNYYTKRIDANTLEVYTDSGLTAKVDFTTQGSGNHTAAPDNTWNNNRHRHFSVEVSNSDLATKNTRFSIPWGYDTTEISTFQANVNVNDGLFRINGAAGSYRQLQFGGSLSDVLVPDGTNTRWSVQANSTAEAGSNAGSDFRITRYTDTGVATDAPLFIERKTGRVAFGMASGLPAVATISSYTDGTQNGVFIKATATGTANVAVVSIESAATGKRVIDYRVTNDGVSRLRLDTSAGSGSGTLTFGDGTTADTNLYRTAATTLKTDNSFHVGADLRHLGSNLGFYNATAVAKQTVTGAKGSNAALASLMTALAALGLVTDSTSA